MGHLRQIVSHAENDLSIRKQLACLNKHQPSIISNMQFLTSIALLLHFFPFLTQNLMYALCSFFISIMILTEGLRCVLI